MIDQLGLYNEALRVCGDRSLSSLSENREPRRMLDSVWGFNFMNAVLEEGQWLFATRSSKFDASPGGAPAYGLQYVFPKPSDWLRTTAMCRDEFYNVPLNRMADEAGNWFADQTPIYVKYISNDPAFGANLALWPPSFALYAGAYLAYQIVGKLANSKVTEDDVEREMEKRLIKALSKDAMNGPTKFLPQGSWARARRAGYGGGNGGWDGSWR